MAVGQNRRRSETNQERLDELERRVERLERQLDRPWWARLLGIEARPDQRGGA